MYEIFRKKYGKWETEREMVHVNEKEKTRETIRLSGTSLKYVPHIYSYILYNVLIH